MWISHIFNVDNFCFYVDKFWIMIYFDCLWLILWFNLTEFDRVWLNLTTRRTPEIVWQIKINQVIKPDQKPDYKLCFLSIYPPISITIVYSIQFAFLHNVQFSTPANRILSLNPGVIYISISTAFCLTRGMGSTPTPHQKSTSPKPTPLQIPTPKLYQILTQFPNRLRQSLRRTNKISLNQYH